MTPGMRHCDDRYLFRFYDIIDGKWEAPHMCSPNLFVGARIALRLPLNGGKRRPHGPGELAPEGPGGDAHTK
jgi:hypothetical protein